MHIGNMQKHRFLSERICSGPEVSCDRIMSEVSKALNQTDIQYDHTALSVPSRPGLLLMHATSCLQ